MLRARSVAALYDIHGNLPALEAVLEDVRRAGAERVVIGGDVVPGPMAREALERLLALDVPADFIHGNCERAVLAQLAAPDPEQVTYWGTVSGNPLQEPYRSRMQWSAHQVASHVSVFERWPRTLRVEIDGLGPVLFCHGTPRSETELFTRRTPPERLRALFGDVGAKVVVCGHTHMQFDLTIGDTRVVNAGSVGAPFGNPGAYWLLLGGSVELRRTSYDVARTADLIRRTGYPHAEQEANGLLHPPTEDDMLTVYETAERTLYSGTA